MEIKLEEHEEAAIHMSLVETPAGNCFYSQLKPAIDATLKMVNQKLANEFKENLPPSLKKANAYFEKINRLIAFGGYEDRTKQLIIDAFIAGYKENG